MIRKKCKQPEGSSLAFSSNMWPERLSHGPRLHSLVEEKLTHETNQVSSLDSELRSSPQYILSTDKAIFRPQASEL
jgi:hypothetical protein